MLEDIAVGSTPLVRTGPAAPEAAGPVAAPSGVEANATATHLSPSLQLNPEIGIVVIQFRSESGAVELSIPSQQQLNAYAADPASARQSDGSTTV